MSIELKIDPMAGLKPFAAILLDVATWAPDLLPYLEADFVSVSRLVKARGLPIFMIDMPLAGKVYDLALSSGFLQWENLPNSFGRYFSKKGGLFEELLNRSFHEDGTIRRDVDPNLVFFTRQIFYWAKKVRSACPEKATQKAIDEFLIIESEMRLPTINWQLDEPNWDVLDKLSFMDGYRHEPDMFSHRDACPRPLLKALDKVTKMLFSHFGTLNRHELLTRHGPGATADVKFGGDKYLLPNWPRKLDLSFPHELYAQSREDLHREDYHTHVSYTEPPAKLIAVPKTYGGPRLIASEPVSHQFLQQGLLMWLRENISRPLQTSINFSDQGPSRDAALAASVDGSLATVDLSSASDRLSCWTVERAFRTSPELLIALHALRTRWLVNATKVGEKFFIPLKKHACQGSAVTFPLQTMIYASIAIATVLYESGRPITFRNVGWAARKVRVFGDDIILPSQAVQGLTLLLSHLGLKVNMSKTHMKGHFRESCGMDAYKGYVVTPVYIRDLELGSSAERLTSWVDVSNNAYTAGLWTLAKWMMDEVPHKVRKLIPVTNRQIGCVTFRTHQDVLVSEAKQRFSKTLHRQEILALQVTGRSIRRRRDSHVSLLQYFVEAPRLSRPWDPPPPWSEGWIVRNRMQIRKRWVPTH